MQAIPGFGKIDYTLKFYLQYLEKIRSCLKNLVKKGKPCVGGTIYWQEILKLTLKIPCHLWSHDVWPLVCAAILSPRLLPENQFLLQGCTQCSLPRSRSLSRHVTFLPTNGCSHSNNIPFPLFLRSNEGANHESANWEWRKCSREKRQRDFRQIV